MIDNDFMESLKRARTYGLGEFLEIIGELSQESTKKGILDRKHKELITLGMALAQRLSPLHRHPHRSSNQTRRNRHRNAASTPRCPVRASQPRRSSHRRKFPNWCTRWKNMQLFHEDVLKAK
jgi:hypothetical protein